MSSQDMFKVWPCSSLCSEKPFCGSAPVCFITMLRWSFICSGRENASAKKAFRPAEEQEQWDLRVQSDHLKSKENSHYTIKIHTVNGMNWKISSAISWCNMCLLKQSSTLFIRISKETKVLACGYLVETPDQKITKNKWKNKEVAIQSHFV